MAWTVNKSNRKTIWGRSLFQYFQLPMWPGTSVPTRHSKHQRVMSRLFSLFMLQMAMSWMPLYSLAILKENWFKLEEEKFECQRCNRYLGNVQIEVFFSSIRLPYTGVIVFIMMFCYIFSCFRYNQIKKYLEDDTVSGHHITLANLSFVCVQMTTCCPPHLRFSWRYKKCRTI